MAVKKCDDTPADHIDEETGEEAVEDCEEGFHKENGICVPNLTQSPSKVHWPVSLGKTLKTVEDSVYTSPDLSTVGVTTAISSIWGHGEIKQARPYGIDDPLRAEARKFFTLNENEQMVYLNSSLRETVGNATDHLTEHYGKSPITITATSDPTERSSTATFKSYSQNFEVTSELFTNNSPWVGFNDETLDNAWQTFAMGGQDTVTGMERREALINRDVTFTDHYTNIHIPFSTEELETYVTNLNTPMYVGIEPKYNFYSKAYEDGGAGPLSTTTVFTEWRLPNLYSILSQDGANTQTILADLGIGSEYMLNINKVYHSQAGQNMMTTGQALAPWIELVDHYQNIGIPSSQIEILPRGSDFDDLHPMNATLELKTDQTGQFLNASETANMTDNLLKFVMSETREWAFMHANVIPPGAWSAKLPFALSREQVVTIRGGALPAAIGLPVIEAEQTVEDLLVTDVENWLQAYFDTNITYEYSPTFDAETLLLGMPDNEAAQSDDCNAFSNVLQALILVGKINQIVNDYFRTFEEMLEGKEAYNEVLVYEIVKKSSAEGASPLQRIFIPNTEKLDILHYIDTQVKYDKEYTYEIFAHNLIVGTQYDYVSFLSSAHIAKTTPKRLTFTVYYEPSLKIVRIPLYTENVRILDSAPVWPNVDLVPYRGVTDQFLINLSSNVGDYELQPITITPRDITFVHNYRHAHKLYLDDPIRFKSDDPVKRFEIYRMDKPPGSYQDFSGHLLTIASSPDATAVSYIDNILPNQKYYYMFRGVDVHQNRSNPTEVYQVEITEFNGMMFFNQRIYDFEDRIKANNNISSTRSFRRYLKINPNLIQSLINYDKTFPPAQGNVTDSAYNANSVVLGQANESLWGKKLKVRITSKTSGRKFDLNLTFKAKYNKVNKPS